MSGFTNCVLFLKNCNASVVENKEMSGNLQKGVHVVEQVKFFSGRGFRMIVCGIYESSITITSA